MNKKPELADLLTETILLIWDKVTIQHRYYFQSVVKLFKDVKSDKRLFKGLPVVLGSDFAQILPIIRCRTRASTVAASI